MACRLTSRSSGRVGRPRSASRVANGGAPLSSRSVSWHESHCGEALESGSRRCLRDCTTPHASLGCADHHKCFTVGSQGRPLPCCLLGHWLRCGCWPCCSAWLPLRFGSAALPKYLLQKPTFLACPQSDARCNSLLGGGTLHYLPRVASRSVAPPKSLLLHSPSANLFQGMATCQLTNRSSRRAQGHLEALRALLAVRPAA